MYKKFVVREEIRQGVIFLMFIIFILYYSEGFDEGSKKRNRNVRGEGEVGKGKK